MWIHVYPNGKMNSNSKNGNKRCSSCETKASISLIRMRRTCLWRQVMKRKEIIIWIRVHPNWKMNFNSKYDNNEVFLIKPKHQYHLSHGEEWVYDAQSWKEKRLLYESMFIPNEIRTSILKMVIREVFLMKRMHQYL